MIEKLDIKNYENKQHKMVTNGDGKMNNDMKCPVCNSYLHKIPVKEAWVCSIHDSKDDLYGSKELWQELIRTRKMLKIAVRAIETIKYSKKSDAINLRHKANKALIEIYKIKDQTALEQKDVK